MTSFEALHAIQAVIDRDAKDASTQRDPQLDEIATYVRLALTLEAPPLEHLAAAYLSDHDLIYDDVPAEGEPWPDPVDGKNHADLVELLRSVLEARKELE
jgi:hypothetical protein